MTREEAIKELKTRYLTMSQCLDKEELHKANNAIDMAIKTLSAESCDDTISREEAKKAMFDLCGDGSLKENPWRDNPNIDAIIDALDNMPPVKPKERTGYWIENAPEYQNIDPPYICSECGHSNLIKTNYCEQCGAKMEREYKE